MPKHLLKPLSTGGLRDLLILHAGLERQDPQKRLKMASIHFGGIESYEYACFMVPMRVFSAILSIGGKEVGEGPETPKLKSRLRAKLPGPLSHYAIGLARRKSCQHTKMWYYGWLKPIVCQVSLLNQEIKSCDSFDRTSSRPHDPVVIMSRIEA